VPVGADASRTTPMLHAQASPAGQVYSVVRTNVVYADLSAIDPGDQLFVGQGVLKASSFSWPSVSHPAMS
jgi:hypothetical protein